MFAARTDKQAGKASGEKRPLVNQTGNGKTIAEGNFLWQSLALHIPGLQAKLGVGKPDDPYEREADATADRIMGMPASPSEINPSRASFSPPRVQRKCKGCEEEEEKKLRRKAEAGVGTSTSSVNSASQVQTALSSSGQTLDLGTRGFFESRFQRDFGNVRIHRGSSADAAASALHASAFTLGSSIVFGLDQYHPQTPAGQWLLAHELAHVAQASEYAASGGGRSARIHRFSPSEHRALGTEASSVVTLTDINYGVSATFPAFLTYGEAVALAGDYFENLQQLRQLASTPAGREQIRWARWWALQTGAEPTVPESSKQAVRDRFFSLAARNITHFSAGGTARNEYQTYHRQALELAFRSGINNNLTLWGEAQTTEAFGHHFLTDMFAGGHVRTPRAAIRAWYQSHYPNSVNSFVTYMARHMLAYLQRQHPYYSAAGLLPTQASLEGTIRSIGGVALQSYTLGDIVSLGFHNRDNQGLNVVTDVNESGAAVPGGFHYTAVGDTMLSTSPTTSRMAVGAMRASLRELDTMRAAATAATPRRPVYAPGPMPNFQAEFERTLAGMTPFAAERFIPREDTSGGNVTMTWQWGSFNRDMRDAVDGAIRNDIVPFIREKAREQTDPNRRDALNDFARHLETQRTRALEAAIGVRAGP